MLGLDIAYWCTKFDHYSFSRSRDITGAHQNLNGSRDLTFQGCFVILGPGLAYLNLPTKFEFYISSHYDEMKRDSKCGKYGGLGSPRVIENSAIQQSSYKFSVLHCFWDIARYWSKITDLNLPHLSLAPRWGDPIGISPRFLVSEN